MAGQHHRDMMKDENKKEIFLKSGLQTSCDMFCTQEYIILRKGL